MEEPQDDPPGPPVSENDLPDLPESDHNIPEDPILDFVNSQCHSYEDLDQALQAYQAYQIPCPQDSTMTPERSINHHFTYMYPSTAEVLRQANLKPITDYLTKRRAGFYDTYLRFSPRFAESQTWRTAGHTRNFPRYHTQQFTVPSEDTETTE